MCLDEFTTEEFLEFNVFNCYFKGYNDWYLSSFNDMIMFYVYNADIVFGDNIVHIPAGAMTCFFARRSLFADLMMDGGISEGDKITIHWGYGPCPEPGTPIARIIQVDEEE